MVAMFPSYYLFHHNFWNNEHKNMYTISICIVFKTKTDNTIKFKLVFFQFQPTKYKNIA